MADKAMQTLRERVFAQRQGKRVRVSPAFLEGAEIELCEMTVGERRDLIERSSAEDGTRDAAQFEALVVIACARDPETKKPVFTLGDRDTLVDLPASVLDALAEPALRMNGLLLNGAPDVGAGLKNSNAIQTSSANSDSPNGSA